MTRPANQFAK